MAHVTAARYVLVLSPTGNQMPKPAPPAADASPLAKKKTDRAGSKADKAGKAEKKEGRTP
jgi:rod shape-determining protein MreC